MGGWELGGGGCREVGGGVGDGAFGSGVSSGGVSSGSLGDGAFGSGLQMGSLFLISWYENRDIKIKKFTNKIRKNKCIITKLFLPKDFQYNVVILVINKVKYGY